MTICTYVCEHAPVSHVYNRAQACMLGIMYTQIRFLEKMQEADVYIYMYACKLAVITNKTKINRMSMQICTCRLGILFI